MKIHRELYMDVRPVPAMPWCPSIELAPRPGAPCLREICDQRFTPAEIALLEKGMRTSVESGTMTGPTANVYLTAEKFRSV